MPEQIEAWWQRRQRSKGTAVPYPIGRYRDAWKTFPALVRQYHPDLNRGIVLSQIPPAADVYVQWQCDSGHLFVATPDEQRSRPGCSRRKSSWCPECSELARGGARPPVSRAVVPEAASPRARPSSPAAGSPLCSRSPAPSLAVGEAFSSPCAPRPASAVEGSLRSRLFARLDVHEGFTAVRLATPFFTHLEAWPDLVIDELKIAIELDTVGRDGLEHVGARETVDRRKDRALRSTGWEVIRVRLAPLLAIGEHDILAAGVSAKLVDRMIDEMAVIRGDLIVRSYLRPTSAPRASGAGTMLPRS
ncbi:zinc-ribbon domain-containing protein [Marisediminicola sp. LYQ134]|uniref:zinc-ribbon domain-containing protein n=1 Tax=Marisediminicola sp. LYQ134 TaxID=3391061 RepID=UPI00398316A8